MSRGRALGPGRLVKRGTRWVIHWTDEFGHRQRHSLSSEKRAAERIRSEIIHKRDLALAGLGLEAGQDMPLSELLALYLEDLGARVTGPHYTNVEQRLTHVVEKLGPITVGELKPMDVLRIRRDAVAAGASHRTANLLVGRLQGMLRWAVESELVSRSPIEHIRRLPETAEHQRYTRRAMSEEEIEKFLAAAEADDRDAALTWDAGRVGRRGFEKRKLKLRIPQAPLWRTLLRTAGRWNEIRLSTWADYDLEKAAVVLQARNTKSRKSRAIPLRKEHVSVIRRLRRLQGAAIGRVPRREDFVFLSPEGCPWAKATTNPMRIFDRVLERAGIDKRGVEGKLDLHAIRHTGLTQLFRDGATLAEVQTIAGHSDPKTTAQIYMHLNVEDLRAAVEGRRRRAESAEAKEAT